MTEEKADASSRTFNGGEVLFAGGTDWSFIGRNLGGSKKKGDTEVRITKIFTVLLTILSMQCSAMTLLQS